MINKNEFPLFTISEFNSIIVNLLNDHQDSYRRSQNIGETV